MEVAGGIILVPNSSPTYASFLESIHPITSSYIFSIGFDSNDEL